MSTDQASDLQHLALGMAPAGTGLRASHPEAAWFPRAGLGLFLHWGISSVHGGVDLSWGMIAGTPWDRGQHRHGKITPNAYYDLAGRFAPERYDPDRWCAAAAAAGFRYAVLTTKHHDGYTLWPTAAGDLGVHSHLGGRDLVAPFVEACRRHGLKVGLYYSPADWWFDRACRSWGYGPAMEAGTGGAESVRWLDMDHRPCRPLAKPAGHDQARCALVNAQLRELLTGYGRIDLLWLDGGGGEMPHAAIRAMQPHIVLNDRNQPERGDFGHSECAMPRSRPDGWFETCTCWGHGWGWRDAILTADPPASPLAQLAALRAMGGNLLLNLPPDPHGELAAPSLAAMSALGDWMRINREAIHDVAGGPWPVDANVPVTCGERAWYAICPPEFPGPVVIHGAPRIARARVLGRDAVELPLQQESTRLIVGLPTGARSSWSHDVVRLDLAG